MYHPVYQSNDPDVIAEEGARFRAMSPQEQIRCFRKILRDVARALQQSPIADFLRGYRTENEEIVKRAFKRFIAQQLAREEQT